jgi:hypothetical protein
MGKWKKLLTEILIIGPFHGLIEASLPCFSQLDDVEKFATHVVIGNKCASIREMDSFVSSYIYSKNCDPNRCMLAGSRYPIIFLVVILRDPDSLAILLKNKKTVIPIMPHGDTLVHLAAINSASCIKVLVDDVRMDVNARNMERKTPLYVAMACNNREAVEALLSADRINTNAMDVMRRNMLHDAVMNGDANVVRQLLNLRDIPYGNMGRSLNINAKDGVGKTPADYLSTIKNVDVRTKIWTLLAAAGAEKGDGTVATMP